MTAAANARDLLDRLGVSAHVWADGGLPTRSPIDGSSAGSLAQASPADVDTALTQASSAFAAWRRVPAPRRGELVRLLGEELRAAKADLAMLVTLEAGKIVSEGLGEVQEMIDICDFATGLSRQLHGLTMPSERPGHHMRETWQPLGPVGVISAFNFPVAVWAWNAALALVCGDPVIWKPSEKTPLTALATQAVFDRAVACFGPDAPPHLSQVLIGGREIGERLAADPRLPLVSATGSTRMGRAVAQSVASRLGRSLLELGGNNAMIVTPSADMDMAVRAIAFSAVGTCGQRCTSLRRLLVHADIADSLTARLTQAYATLPIGDPRQPETLVGPLIDADATTAFEASLSQAVAQGGTILKGGTRVAREGGHYVTPAIVRMPAGASGQTDVVRHETFAPILYVLTWTEFDEAVALQNDVPQGLSSCVFTDSVREAEAFLSAWGSDCGIANVNIGPSGAEIGGAFGGEKDTGGGRESGSDAWKAYMRRQTQTVNFSSQLPLAQGVRFDV
ncbi:L-piperidine-6-carboxylate dehydrogenase [Brevundimonas variabilis]|uniref:aldehyde dehydrogenase (NAD(+)) n=1 Tax=Brevundimonas variabilis TaxID=74312 RepID=A0A7W9FEJ7_9CAUL|nr:aldehyde dehydrogenase family protein [Brevundimonas variabilis]MBB5744598.1 aldehyde dehydrogenase (NAD+) [Brevundimonas variabilis]